MSKEKFSKSERIEAGNLMEEAGEKSSFSGWQVAGCRLQVNVALLVRAYGGF